MDDVRGVHKILDRWSLRIMMEQILAVNSVLGMMKRADIASATSTVEGVLGCRQEFCGSQSVQPSLLEHERFAALCKTYKRSAANKAPRMRLQLWPSFTKKTSALGVRDMQYMSSCSSPMLYRRRTSSTSWSWSQPTRDRCTSVWVMSLARCHPSFLSLTSLLLLPILWDNGHNRCSSHFGSSHFVPRSPRNFAFLPLHSNRIDCCLSPSCV